MSLKQGDKVRVKHSANMRARFHGKEGIIKMCHSHCYTVEVCGVMIVLFEDEIEKL